MRGRKIEVERNSNHSNGEAQQRRCNCEISVIEMKIEGQCCQGCATSGWHCVESAREYGWHSPDDHVTDSATSDCGDRAKHRGLEGTQMRDEGNSGAGDTKQGKARSVEYGH